MHGVDEECGQHCRRNIRSFNGGPEDSGKNQEHDRKTDPPIGQETVKCPIYIDAGLFESAYLRCCRNLLCRLERTFGHLVLKIGGKFPSKFLCLFKDFGPLVF